MHRNGFHISGMPSKLNLYKQFTLLSDLNIGVNISEKRDWMTKKRGQITLFMILGVVLVIALILVLVVRNRTTLAQYLPEALFPTQTGTIERFIEDCTDIVGREGLSLLPT